jgi:cell division septation protein DedD
VWFAGRWVPSSATAAVRAENRPAAPVSVAPVEPAPSIQPKPAVTPPSRPGANPAQAPPAAAFVPAQANPPLFYVQLLATHSEDAARSLTAQLAGRKTAVIAPQPGTGDENWRVWAGPFRSREAADSAGRDIGIAYWIVDRTREGRP